MLQYMITRCTLLLRSYPTSLDEDVATMKEEQVINVHGSTRMIFFCKLIIIFKDPITRNNVQLRLSEKRILVSTVAYCEQTLKEF